MVWIPILPTAITLAFAAATGQTGGGAPADQKKARAEAIELAKTTLSREKSIRVEDLKLESATAVRWEDTSLGCPKPGMMYAQRIVAGYKIVLRAADSTYDVHVGEGEAVVCVKPAVSDPKAPRPNA
jgi:hypothetical protein